MNYFFKTWFVSSGWPWIARGGNHIFGLDTGVFAINGFQGNTSFNISFRVVLVTMNLFQ